MVSPTAFLAMVMCRYVNATVLSLLYRFSLTVREQKLRFTNAMWDETARLDTVSPAGQMEAAEDDVLPAVPELNMPPRHIKK